MNFLTQVPILLHYYWRKSAKDVPSGWLHYGRRVRLAVNCVRSSYAASSWSAPEVKHG
jgi:hypothetical protein